MNAVLATARKKNVQQSEHHQASRVLHVFLTLHFANASYLSAPGPAWRDRCCIRHLFLEISVSLLKPAKGLIMVDDDNYLRALFCHHGVQAFGKRGVIIEECFTPTFLIFLFFVSLQEGILRSAPAFFVALC